MSGTTINQLVKTLEDALAIVARQSKENLEITLTKAELELSVAVTDKMSAGIKFDWGLSFDFSGELQASNTHVLSLSLVPRKGMKLGTESAELADAIIALAKAIKEADQGKFTITEGKVDLKFVVTTEGNIRVVGGGGTKKEGTHGVKLTFLPSRSDRSR